MTFMLKLNDLIVLCESRYSHFLLEGFSHYSSPFTCLAGVHNQGAMTHACVALRFLMEQWIFLNSFSFARVALAWLGPLSFFSAVAGLAF